VASFRATLEETREADLLLHVIDVSHPAWEEHRQVVDEVLAELGLHDRPVLHVFNKIDRLEHDESIALQPRLRAMFPSSIFVSATTEGGLEPLRRSLLAELRRLRPVSEVRVPLSDGRLIAELHRAGEVLEQRSEGDEWVVTARVDEATLGRLKRQGATVRA
jgi:GTP-binding protein HflX